MQMSTIGGSSGASGANSFGAIYGANRLTGLLSGLDTDALVASMTSVQQAKIYKTQQRQTRQSWLEDAWRNIQDTIKTFQNTYISATGSSSMLKSATYYSYKVTSDSNSSAVSLSASSVTEAGAYSVKVEKLAQNASISSSNISALGTTEISASNNAKLSELKFANSLEFVGDKISFSINGKVFSFSSDTTLQSMINTINNDETANVTIKYSRLTNGFTITADSGGANSRVVIKNLLGNAFGTNSAFGIPEGSVTSTGTIINSNNIIRGINPATSLGDLSFAKDLTFDENGNISFSINGETFQFSKSTKLENMLAAINGNENAGVTMTYDAVLDGFTITSDSGGTITIENLTGNAFGTDGAFGIPDGTSEGDTLSSANISGLDTAAALSELSFAKKLTFNSSGRIEFSINGKVFSFDKTTTLDDMLETINNDAEANVTMAYNRQTRGFLISSNSPEKGDVVIKNISGNAFGINSAFGIAETSTKQSADAVAVINGTTVTRSTNEFVIDNMTYKLNAVTAGTADETINFLVTRDYSATIEAVKTFVDAFNKMIKTFKDLVDEKDYSAEYPPLTDAQEAEMTESQIEAWNKKAKSGLLRHNAALTRFISDLKNAFYSSLGGTGKNMTSIGITTASYFDSNAGELVVDMVALEKALATNPEQVVAMFTNGNSGAESSQQGLMYKLSNIMNSFNKTLKTTISTTEDRISDYDETIKDMQVRLDELAERYYQKFAAMETALSRLSAQNMFISQMFSSGNG